MSKRVLKAAIEAMLADEATPEIIREIGEMAEDGDLVPEEPDEDTGPVDPKAAKRVKDWLEKRALEELADWLG
jgi:hypothetical protein